MASETQDQFQVMVQQALSELRDIHSEVEALTMTVDDLKNQFTLEQVVSFMDMTQQIVKALNVSNRDVMLAGTALIPKGEKTVTWKSDDGQEFVTELKWSSRRTAVAKDDLLNAVKETARTVDTDTGEVSVDYRNLLTTVEKAYRLEPRWTEIKNLGINPDEFCETKYEPTLTTTPKGSDQ